MQTTQDMPESATSWYRTAYVGTTTCTPTSTTSKIKPSNFVCTRGCGCFFRERCWGADSHSNEDKTTWRRENLLKRELHDMRVKQTLARLQALKDIVEATSRQGPSDRRGTQDTEKTGAEKGVLAGAPRSSKHTVKKCVSKEEDYQITEEKRANLWRHFKAINRTSDVQAQIEYERALSSLAAKQEKAVVKKQAAAKAAAEKAAAELHDSNGGEQRLRNTDPPQRDTKDEEQKPSTADSSTRTHPGKQTAIKKTQKEKLREDTSAGAAPSRGGKCKCGSTKHSRTNHRDCPLKRNRQGADPPSGGPHQPSNAGGLAAHMGGSWEPEEQATINAKAYYESWDVQEQFKYFRRAMGRTEEVGSAAPGWSAQTREQLLERLVYAFVDAQIVFRKEDSEWVWIPYAYPDIKDSVILTEGVVVR